MRSRSERLLLWLAGACAALCITSAAVSAANLVTANPAFKVKRASGPGELPPPRVIQPSQQSSTPPPAF